MGGGEVTCCVLHAAAEGANAAKPEIVTRIVHKATDRYFGCQRTARQLDDECPD
jgi:hypothetical protein